jgi:hypothetical protein
VTDVIFVFANARPLISVTSGVAASEGKKTDEGTMM